MSLDIFACAIWSLILSGDQIFLQKHDFWVKFFPKFSTVFLGASLLSVYYSVDISAMCCLFKSTTILTAVNLLAYLLQLITALDVSCTIARLLQKSQCAYLSKIFCSS